jgi:DNA-binding transcriptional LysR family regulator
MSATLCWNKWSFLKLAKSHLDWDKLRVFSVVAELKSMTAAAKRLGESTPTVSRKIDDLEKTLSCELLVRSTKGVELTEAGRQVIQRTHVMNDNANQIFNTVNGLDIEGSGKIRMTAQDGVVSHWLSRYIPDFQAENSGIELEMQITEKDIDLLSSEADLNVTFTQPRHRDILSMRLGTLHYMFFASESYLAHKGRPESLYDLHGHDVLMHEAYSNQIDSWSTRAIDLKKTLNFKLHTNSGTVLREVCACGGGIAVMPSYLSEIDNRLVALDLPEVAPIEFWLTYTQRAQRLSRGRVLIDWMRKQFSAETTPWFRETFLHPNKLETDPASHADQKEAG